MSRQRELIGAALAAKGYSITSCDWEPIGMGAEKAGARGGWFVLFKPSATDDPRTDREVICGYNVTEVLEDIAQLPGVPA